MLQIASETATFGSQVWIWTEYVLNAGRFGYNNNHHECHTTIYLTDGWHGCCNSRAQRRGAGG